MFTTLSKSGTLRQKESSLGWKLILPTVMLIALLILYPVIYNIYLSFFEVSIGTGADSFVGFENYRNVLSDGSFLISFLKTVLFTALTVGGSIILGLGVALMMNRPFFGRGLVRALILLPYITPLIAIVFAWKYIFLPVDGPLTRLMADAGLVDSGMDLINDPNNSLYVVIIFKIW